MILCKGNMWSEYDGADLFLITTNSTIKQTGALVMGRGIAKQARDRFKGLDLALGRRIEHLSTYGLLVSEKWPERKIGAFQVKWDYRTHADLGLIGYSVARVEQFIIDNVVMTVHLNFPGIGYGNLERKDVLPIIEKLPNNVHVWEYENE
jgi:hypothetical protein